MKKKVLIIDDDKKMNSLLSDFLSKFGHQVFSVTSGSDALKEIPRIDPDIIILDIMLPGMDGFETCREIRKKYKTPIIMLTARGDVTDRVVGLEMGADDYMPKPFEPRELVARIQSVLRRSSLPVEKSKRVFGELDIDYLSHSVSYKGVPITLTNMEFELLSYFTKNEGIVLSRDKIFERLKGLDDDSFDRSIDVLVSRLRQKIGDDPKNPRFIRTIRGSGYKFIGR